MRAMTDTLYYVANLTHNLSARCCLERSEFLHSSEELTQNTV